MRVSKAIEVLKTLNQDDHIIIAWWDKESISSDTYYDNGDTKFSSLDDVDWEFICDEVEFQFDWSSVQQELEDVATHILENSDNLGDETYLVATYIPENKHHVEKT